MLRDEIEGEQRKLSKIKDENDSLQKQFIEGEEKVKEYLIHSRECEAKLNSANREFTAKSEQMQKTEADLKAKIELSSTTITDLKAKEIART